MTKRAALVVAAVVCACSCTATPRSMPLSGLNSVPATALYARGIAARDGGDITRAEQYLAAALERGYPATSGLPVLLDLCVAAERYETALHYARRHLLKHPTDWALRYVVATLELALGDVERARTEAKRIVQQDPGHAAPWYLLGVIAATHDHSPRRAARNFRAYLLREPNGRRAAEVTTWLRRRRAERSGRSK